MWIQWSPQTPQKVPRSESARRTYKTHSNTSPHADMAPPRTWTTSERWAPDTLIWWRHSGGWAGSHSLTIKQFKVSLRKMKNCQKRAAQNGSFSSICFSLPRNYLGSQPSSNLWCGLRRLNHVSPPTVSNVSAPKTAFGERTIIPSIWDVFWNAHLRLPTPVGVATTWLHPPPLSLPAASTDSVPRPRAMWFEQSRFIINTVATLHLRKTKQHPPPASRLCAPSSPLSAPRPRPAGRYHKH